MIARGEQTIWDGLLTWSSPDADHCFVGRMAKFMGRSLSSPVIRCEHAAGSAVALFDAPHGRLFAHDGRTS